MRNNGKDGNAQKKCAACICKAVLLLLDLLLVFHRSCCLHRLALQPLASSRLCRLGLDSNKLKAIYTLPFRLTKDTKLCMFQYKIIHNILPYGSKLYKMKISNSPLCVHCNSLETLPHMLVNCTEINSFWAKIISWWNHQSRDCYLVDELSIRQKAIA